MTSNAAVVLINLPRRENIDKDIFKNKPYLRVFANPSVDIKIWEGSDSDYNELNNVLQHHSMDKLKRMLLGGAPYLHKINDITFAMTNAAFYSRTDIMEIILVRHKYEGTPGEREEFEYQTGEALYTICSTNCGDIVRALLEANTPVIPEAHLNEAAKTGSTAVLDEILKFYPNLDINILDEEGNSPLHNAVERKHTHTVQYLLNKNADPNMKNFDGYSSVHMACQYTDDDILYLLTTRGGDVNVRENKGKTPALIAAENGKDGCIQILATAGANLDQRDNHGNAPLTVAAGMGHTNTVKELILNGASFDVTDNDRYNALEKAILNKKDGAAAIFIRLSPQTDYVGYFMSTVEISWLKIVHSRMTETMNAFLDKMLVQSNPLESTRGEVHTEYLDYDTSRNTPADYDYDKNKTFLLQRISGLVDENLAYHGTIRILVDKKMKQFGNLILGVKLFFYVLFLLALAYSLILQASYSPIELNEYTTSGPSNILRIFTELFVLFYFLFNLVTEGVEFFQVTRQTFQYLKDKKIEKEKDEARAATIETDFGHSEDYYGSIEIEAPPTQEETKRPLKSKLNDYVFIRIFTDYFSDKANYMDVPGLITLFILILLRLSTQPAQWVFATLTFLINGLRLFKLLSLLPHLGPYTNIIHQILKNDVPLFSSLFLITLLIFTGGFFISLRTPYTSAGFANASLMTDTERTTGVDNGVQFVLLSGLRVLLEGNVYEDGYLYQQLNWLAASIYLEFLFLITVVYINVFIAQLSDTYGILKQNAQKTYAWQRLNFIVQVQRTSLLSLCVDYRKKYFTKVIPIGKEQMFEYYGVHSIKNLNVKSSTEGADVKEMLATINNQQVVARKTNETSKLNIRRESSSFNPQQQQQQSDEIRKLRSEISQLLEEIRQRDVLLEERLEKSNQALLEIIEVKLNNFIK